jgi:GTPase involved in cell partitioning and DNA repair
MISILRGYVFFFVHFVSIGGKGNYYFLSNMNRAPTECELGANGDKKIYKLELQLIAHFGLVK